MSNFVNRIRKWFAAREAIEQLRRLGDQEAGRIARDAGVGLSDLYQLNRLGPDAKDLLPRRLNAVGLDAQDVGKRNPALLRDMQRVCTFCQRHGSCARDLSRQPHSERWKAYCPNAATIEELAVRADEPA